MADAPKITFNLEAVEREGKRPEPYVVGLPGGGTLRLVDPKDKPSNEILAAGDSPLEIMRLCVDESEDRSKIKKLLEVPAWKLELLMDDFMLHFGLDRAGNGRGSRG